MLLKVCIFLFFITHQHLFIQCDGEQGQCGGVQEEEPSDGGCGGGGEDFTEKDAFLNMVGASEDGAGGCGAESDEEEGGGQCGGEQDEDASQCGSGGDYTEKDAFLELVGAGGNEGGGGCGGGGEQYDEEEGGGQCGGGGGDGGASTDDEQMEGDNTSYLSGFMTSLIKEYENLSGDAQKLKFSKLLPKIDANSDEAITFDELHRWVLREIEEETKTMDLSSLNFSGQDIDSDGKLSWEEFEAEQKKLINEKTNVDKFWKKEKIKFKYVDKNENGFIDTNELSRLAMPDGFSDMNEMVVDQFIVDYDTNNDDEISKSEFLDNAKDDPNIYNAEQQFTDYDKNADQILTKDEFRPLAIEYIAAPHIKIETEAIFNELDVNDDKKLSYEELMNGHVYFTDETKMISTADIEKLYQEYSLGNA